MVESCAIKINSSGGQTHFAERIDRQLLLAAAIIVVCGSRGIQRNGGLFGTKGDLASTMCVGGVGRCCAAAAAEQLVNPRALCGKEGTKEDLRLEESGGGVGRVWAVGVARLTID